MSRPILYGAVRSSAAYRVRIALNLKGVDYESRQLNLLSGEQQAAEYRAINPQGLVPMLEIDGHRLTQSLSIIMYLASRFPDPPLLPSDPADAAHVRGMALAIACDIHPLNNLRVLRYLKAELAQPQEWIDRWYVHWITEGFTALEATAAPRAGDFLFGDQPSIADICLVPQLFNARRYDLALDAYPTLLRAEANANRIEAFAAAHPDRQEVPA
jgi:maleylacetoacetate isomerase